MRLVVKMKSAQGEDRVDYSEPAPVSIDRNLVFSAPVHASTGCGQIGSLMMEAAND